MRRGLLAVLAAILLGATPTAAQQISPLIFDLTPSGEGARRDLEVQNTGARPIAFEVLVARRTYDEEGGAHEQAADADLEIQPQQLWIEPGGAAKVGVHYVGDAAINAAVLYVVTFKQALISNVSEPSEGIDLVYEFRTLAHVAPTDAKPKLQVTSIDVDRGVAVVTLRNIGTKTARIDRGFLQLREGDRVTEVPGESLISSSAAPWLLAGGQRRLKVVLPSDFALDQPLSAVWSVSPEGL